MPSHDSSSSTEADFAKAFSELARGERTAAAMEGQLTNLERKIDDLLASVDEHSLGEVKSSDEDSAGKDNLAASKRKDSKER